MPLPYAVGVLHSYVFHNSEIMMNYEFPDYIFEKKPIDIVSNQLSDAYAVFFSCYIWNYEYNKALAQSIASNYPAIKLIFGGHNVPLDVKRAFAELPCADYIMIGEGEKPFEDILLMFLGQKSKDDLYNIAYRDLHSNIVFHYSPNYVTDKFVSPYQLGLFDKIVETYGDRYHFSATLETNRGCPFSCAYCDWGLNKENLRFASEKQIIQDIKWMSAHHIEECYGADSNFGMFKRDIEFAKTFAKCKHENGYPKRFYVSFSKNSDDTVLEITCILREASMLQGATLSFQSLNPATLSAIGRKNLDLDYFRQRMKQYHKRQIPTYSELILGLPMETEASFKSGIATLMEHGQHSSIDIYECCILPNSDLGQKDNLEKYGIVALRLPFRRFDVKQKEEIQEYSNIVVQTSTMSKKEWQNCNLFYNFVTALHFDKLFHCIALYLYKECHLPYDEIYNRIIEFMASKKDSVWNELISRISIQLSDISSGNGGWQFTWPELQIFDESFSKAISKTVIKNYGDYRTLLESFLKSYFYDDELIRQLVKFQSFCITTRIDHNLLRYETFDYAFVPYFEALYSCENATLQHSKSIITGNDIIQSLISL